MENLYDPLLRRQKKTVTTDDGSRTLYSAEFDECYHSTRDGALRESIRKHVAPAFDPSLEKEVYTVLDVCFGLGYNSWSTLYYLKEKNSRAKIHIVSPEFDRELIASLEDFRYPEEFGSLKNIIHSVSKTGRYEDETVKVEILFGDARETIPQISEKIDIVYQDAFSPRKNPLLWTREYFADIAKISSPDLILTTYSSATSVRMGMHENGLLLYETPDRSVRRGTIASFRPLNLPEIDMELKKRRNPLAASLRDADFKNSTV